MAELETISVKNPTDEEFLVRFNGELYSLPANSSKFYPQFLGFHIAKHLSDKMLLPEIEKLQKKHKDDPYVPAVGQLTIYDNPSRRIALHQVLGDRKLVEACIAAFPFKSFIGDMKEYDDFITRNEKKAVKTVDAE